MPKIQVTEVMTEKVGPSREEFLQTVSDEETDCAIAFSMLRRVKITYDLLNLETVNNREFRTR